MTTGRINQVSIVAGGPRGRGSPAAASARWRLRVVWVTVRSRRRGDRAPTSGAREFVVGARAFACTCASRLLAQLIGCVGGVLTLRTGRLHTRACPIALFGSILAAARASRRCQRLSEQRGGPRRRGRRGARLRTARAAPACCHAGAHTPTQAFALALHQVRLLLTEYQCESFLRAWVE